MGNCRATSVPGPNAGFTSAQLADIEIPVMLMGGTEDENVPIENNDIAFEQLTEAPAVHKVAIDGATHTHFANVCTFGELLVDLGIEEAAWPDIGAADLVEPYRATCAPEVFPIDEAVRLQNLYTVAFLKRHLVGDEDYDWFLTEEFAAERAGCHVRVAVAGESEVFYSAPGRRAREAAMRRLFGILTVTIVGVVVGGRSRRARRFHHVSHHRPRVGRLRLLR